MRRLLPSLAAVAAAVTLAACSGGAEPGPSTDASFEPGFGHVHGVDLNPADGMIYAATHYGVFRLGPEGPQRIADRFQDTMGFTIAGPDRFLGSGHPDLREPGPAQLGLVVSEDRAETWTKVALAGEADFHALSAVGDTVYGLNATDGTVLRSDDAGRTWQPGAELAAADLDADPADPQRAVATTADGLVESTDGGLTFAPAAAQPPQPVVLVDHVAQAATGQPVLVGVDPGGGVRAFDGSGWATAGALPGPPEAFTVVGPTRFLAATADGVFESGDGGRTWELVAATDG